MGKVEHISTIVVEISGNKVKVRSPRNSKYFVINDTHFVKTDDKMIVFKIEDGDIKVALDLTTAGFVFPIEINGYLVQAGNITLRRGDIETLVREFEFKHHGKKITIAKTVKDLENDKVIIFNDRWPYSAPLSIPTNAERFVCAKYHYALNHRVIRTRHNWHSAIVDSGPPSGKGNSSLYIKFSKPGRAYVTSTTRFKEWFLTKSGKILDNYLQQTGRRMKRSDKSPRWALYKLEDDLLLYYEDLGEWYVGVNTYVTPDIFKIPALTWDGFMMINLAERNYVDKLPKSILSRIPHWKEVPFW